MTFPEVMQSINDNNLALVISKKGSGLLFEMYRKRDEDFVSTSFRATPLQFKYINSCLEQMIKYLMEQ